MRRVAMCSSILQVPRCRIHTLASSWWESFQSLRTPGNSYSFRLLGSRTSGLEGGHCKRWIRKTITTKAEGRNKDTVSGKTGDASYKLSIVSSKLNVGKSEISEFQRIQYCDIQQKFGESEYLASLVTVVVFDIETTGFSRENERIIEIALQDLEGGENSTFQTLVNPERYIPNPHVHGISTHMVNKPDVPRMKDLIPILLQYISSRQKPGGHVLWVAHNARSFDVPFLVNEFNRCSFNIPLDWLFLDTLPLAREVMNSGGSKIIKTSLQALCKSYGIPPVGSAHRAMSDVKSLSLVFQRITFDLKLSMAGLVERSFKPSDLTKIKKKTSSG